jgi:hypothetical protein
VQLEHLKTEPNKNFEKKNALGKGKEELPSLESCHEVPHRFIQTIVGEKSRYRSSTFLRSYMRRCGESWLGSDPILKMFGARRSLNHSYQKLTPVNSWDCIPKPFNASPATENFRLFAWGVIGVFVPVA